MSNAFKWSMRSINNFKGVHPDLVAVANLALANSPYDFIVIDGVRDLEKQKQLVASGASQTLNSRHLKQKDGFGHAIDIVPIIDGGVRWELPLCAAIAASFKKAAVTLGVVNSKREPAVKWGGDWARFKDGPHFELDVKVYGDGSSPLRLAKA